jgi:hypothetical protein
MAHEEHETRLADFQAGYGNEGDPAWILGGLMIEVGETITAITGKRIADEAMGIIALSLNHFDGDWRFAIEENCSSIFSEWKMGSDLYALAGYAQAGVRANEITDADTFCEFIRDTIESAEALKNQLTINKHVDPVLKQEFSDIVSMAVARWNIDNDAPVQPEGLARLAGISDSRMRSLAKGSDDAVLPLNDKREIAASVALDWLKTQPKFKSSIWRSSFDKEASDKPRAAVPFNPIFVPEAADGSRFLPDLATDRGFQIGEKGDEVYVADYDEALRQLQMMDPPRWRRPSPVSGKMSVVVGARFVRVNRNEIAA